MPAPPRLVASQDHPGTCRIEIRNLQHFRGRQRLLDIPSLELRSAGPSLLIGPNGAGKSLLLRLVHGLLPTVPGTVRVTDPSARGPVQQAMVFQKPVLLRRSVADNIAFALAARGVPRRLRRAQITVLLAIGRLTEKANQPARLMSGGEQQRLALLRALATDPGLLLLDEPTAPLDPNATQEIEALIAAASAAGTKVVMVTHDLGQARRLAEDIVVLHKGRVIEHTAAKRFFVRPQTEAARAFLAGDLLR